MFADVRPARPLPITITSYESWTPLRKSFAMGGQLDGRGFRRKRFRRHRLNPNLPPEKGPGFAEFSASASRVPVPGRRSVHRAAPRSLLRLAEPRGEPWLDPLPEPAVSAGRQKHALCRNAG